MEMESLRDAIRTFTKERDWEQFQSPKNLAIAVSVEAAELLEVFQWLTLEQSENLSEEHLGEAKDEIGDVLICLLNLCNRLDLDPVQLAVKKLEKSRLKYPVEKSKGRATKYNKI